MGYFLCFLFLFFISTNACCVHQSKVSYFPRSSALSGGACGYGSLATTTSYYGGHLAAANPSIYHSIYNYGTACGACFKIRCKNTKVCSKEGTQVIVTDMSQNKKTGFVLSNTAFRSMANKGMDKELLKLGVADVEYKRVHCHYKKNLAIRVEESSRKPDYLAVKFLYQGGKTQIVVAQVGQVNSSDLVYMNHPYGAIWDVSTGQVTPDQFFSAAGPLRFRVAVAQSADGKWIHFKNELPADWKVGDIYDSGVQINDAISDACSPCEDGTWK